MNALINTKSYESNTFLTAIQAATPEQVDALWSILKYKEIGIFRKIKSMSAVLQLNFNDIVNTLPQDENGRMIDHKTRHMIHDVLIHVS